MPRFSYKALNAADELIAGQVEAEGVQQAIVQLEAAGLVVQSIGYAQQPESHRIIAHAPLAPSAAALPSTAADSGHAALRTTWRA